jgi:hypothetical protein
MTKDLEWGQTPWDDLSRDDLLREVRRMYAAIVALETVAKLCRVSDEASPFWSMRGTGGRGLEHARQILQPLHAAYGSESIFRSYFRYAVDLLFDGLGVEWAVCDVCGQMLGGHLGADGSYKSVAGQPCASHLGRECSGILRPLKWEDLQRQDAELANI